MGQYKSALTGTSLSGTVTPNFSQIGNMSASESNTIPPPTPTPTPTNYLGYVLNDDIVLEFAQKHGTVVTLPDGAVNITRTWMNFLWDINAKSGIFAQLVYLKDSTGETPFLRIASSLHPDEATRERVQK